MPDTGLFDDPTMPTILADTAAKKKPNSAISAAPSSDTGTAGTSQMKTTTHAMAANTAFSGRSRPASAAPASPRPRRNTRRNTGADFRSDMNPPIAIAPAPTWRT